MQSLLRVRKCWALSPGIADTNQITDSVESPKMTQEVEDKPPTHIVADWNYFLKHLDGRNIQINSYFDKENWKINTVYQVRVSHIYDPSHFWVVIKENEVDALHKYLHQFYSKYKVHYKIPYKNFKINMYCVAYTEGAFYRCILVNVPLAIECDSLAFVFLIDFGFTAKVSPDEFYFMTTKMYSVPQFAVRATLSGMGPVDSTTWSPGTVSKFSALICNKILQCQVTNKNYAQKIIYVKLGEYNWNTRNIDTINDILVTERLAKQMSILDVREMKHAEKRKRTKGSKKIKLPFLMPTFEEIEKGVCLDCILSNKFLDAFVRK